MKTLMKFFIPLLIITLSPLLVEAGTCCTWYANGCENRVSIHRHASGDTGFLYTNCGDGYIAAGYGLYGGCPGTEHNCSVEPQYAYRPE